MQRKIFGSLFCSVILSVLYILILLSGAVLADENKHTYKVTNTADYPLGCRIMMTFGEGEQVEFTGIAKGQSVQKESKKCLKGLDGCCYTPRPEGRPTCMIIGTPYGLKHCSGAEYEIRPIQGGFSEFVRVK